MIGEAVTSWARSAPRVKARLRRALHAIGYDTADWMRIVTYQQCFSFVRDLGPKGLDVPEISAGRQWSREFVFRSYTATTYPDFDICPQTLPGRFDLLKMLRPHGHAIITVPFLVRVHKPPADCTRWTEEGLDYFLQGCGFAEAGITTGSCGNRACLKANLNSWRKRGLFGSLGNEPEVPVMVWAFARKLPRHQGPLSADDAAAANQPIQPATPVCL
jgi:hypothetical protein